MFLKNNSFGILKEFIFLTIKWFDESTSFHTTEKNTTVIYGLYAYTRVNVNTKQLLINKDENVNRYEVTGVKIERLRERSAYC